MDGYNDITTTKSKQTKKEEKKKKKNLLGPLLFLFLKRGEIIRIPLKAKRQETSVDAYFIKSKVNKSNIAREQVHMCECNVKSN